MERVIQALTRLVTRDSFKGATPAAPRQIQANLDDAPDSIRALADALASRYYNVDLGEFSMFENGGSGAVQSLAPSIEMACDTAELEQEDFLASAGPGGSAFDPDLTLDLGPDGGGMSTLGVSWNDGKVTLVVVEIEDPTPENLLTHFSTPAELFAFLDAKSRGKQLPDVDALKAAAGVAVARPETPKPAGTSGMRRWDGPTPPHPHALAQAHFDTPRMLHQAGPSPAGRTLVARRFKAGTPPVPTVVAVLNGESVERSAEWPAPRDLYAACSIPNTERALLCTGTPGPLVEFDLVTGEERELLPEVGWGAGFLDEQHLAVLASAEVHVHRYDDGKLSEPVAKVPVEGYNIFVGHGRVFSKTKDFSASSIQVLAWDGKNLNSEGTFPVAAKLFAFHAAAEHDGQRLLCAVDTNGVPTWIAYG